MLLDYELPEYLAQYLALPHSLERRKEVRTLLPQGIAAALYYLMVSVDPVREPSSISRLGVWESRLGSRPGLACGRTLPQRKCPLPPIAIVARAALTVLAGNLTRQERPFPSGLVWQGSTDKSVPFPVIV